MCLLRLKYMFLLLQKQYNYLFFNIHIFLVFKQDTSPEELSNLGTNLIIYISLQTQCNVKNFLTLRFTPLGCKDIGTKQIQFAEKLNAFVLFIFLLRKNVLTQFIFRFLQPRYQNVFNLYLTFFPARSILKSKYYD